MIFTLYYMYATALQWWRLGALKNKINGTLNSHNALMLCSGVSVTDSKKQRSLENLLFQNEDRVGYTVVPKQKMSLAHWVPFPRDPKFFPIHFRSHNVKLKSPNIYVLIQAVLETYTKHQSEIIEVENFGELVAWRAQENFELVLKTDIENLTKLVHCFSQNCVDINHELRLLTLETIDVEGYTTKIKYDKPFHLDQKLKYSYAPVHWKTFVSEVKELYSKIHDSLNPKIKIENGSTITEVSEDKNTLEVSSGDHRRHKVKPSEDRQRKPKENSVKKLPDKNITDGKVNQTVPKITATDVDKLQEKILLQKSSDQTEPEIKLKSDDQPNGDVKTKDESLSNSIPQEATPVKQVIPVSEATVPPVSPEPNIPEIKEPSPSTSKTTPKQSGTSPKCLLASYLSKSKEKKKEKGKSEEKKDTKSKEKLRDKFKLSPDRAKENGEVTGKKGDEKKEKNSKDDSGKKKDKKDKTPEKKEPSDKPKEKKLFDIKLCRDKSKSKSVNEAESVKSSKSKENLLLESQSVNAASISEESSKPKPPNVLVYADSLVAKENVKSVLQSIINNEKYTVYDLPVNTQNVSWNTSTTLVIVCGSVPPNLTSHLLEYLISGGRLLCLCSDLLYSILYTFTTAEVREHELVRFSYGEWQQVKMMHHIFCYQASPAKKQFSRDCSSENSNSNQSSSNGSSPVAPPRTPSAVEIQHNGKDYTIQVQVLGTEETWQTPSLLLATVKNSTGKAIFSQVHLEIDPMQYEDDESKYTALKDSNQARLAIIKDILSTQLDVDCTRKEESLYKPAYFLGRHDLKLNMLMSCENVKNNHLSTSKLDLVFCGKNDEPGEASERRLPVLIHSCPIGFSTVQYFDTLETEKIGRLVLYCDVVTSSQFVIEKKLTHGLVIIPRIQTQGLGRSQNTWLSPDGCAAFSMQLHIPLDSPLGKFLPLVQQLVMVAVVCAIKNSKGCKSLNLGVKWPNDLYADSKVKIGGLIVTSLLEESTAIVNIGCGVNLSNSDPTTCINDVIARYNREHKTFLKPLCPEKYFASVFNEVERIYNTVQEGDLDCFYNLYYKHWLHKDSEITVKGSDGTRKKVTILGIDEFGFLKVRSESGEISSVQPDGNSFDMLNGLIAPKIF